jgi:hypothetical protein
VQIWHWKVLFSDPLFFSWNDWEMSNGLGIVQTLLGRYFKFSNKMKWNCLKMLFNWTELAVFKNKFIKI